MVIAGFIKMSLFLVERYFNMRCKGKKKKEKKNLMKELLFLIAYEFEMKALL